MADPKNAPPSHGRAKAIGGSDSPRMAHEWGRGRQRRRAPTAAGANGGGLRRRRAPTAAAIRRGRGFGDSASGNG